MNEKNLVLDSSGNVTEDATGPDAEKAETERQLAQKLLELQNSSGSDPVVCARVQLDIAELLISLERKKEAWTLARDAFDSVLAFESWQDAVEACNVLYQTEQADSISALGMGVWLAVTFPVDPELTYAMLDHIVDETPSTPDGAALAAVTARYVIDLRAPDDKHESQSLLANNLIARVAARHANVQDQAALDVWMNELGLREPQDFLPRLGKVVNTLVGEAWWFDRDALRDRLPD